MHSWNDVLYPTVIWKTWILRVCTEDLCFLLWLLLIYLTVDYLHGRIWIMMWPLWPLPRPTSFHPTFSSLDFNLSTFSIWSKTCVEASRREIWGPRPQKKRPKISSTLLIYVRSTRMTYWWNTIFFFTEWGFSFCFDGWWNRWAQISKVWRALKLLTSTLPREGHQLRFR